MEIRPCYSSPHLRGQVQSYYSPVFPLFPSSFYQVVCGSIYSFRSVRYFCPLSPGVLYALQGLREMYSTYTYSSTILFSQNLGRGFNILFNLVYYIFFLKLFASMLISDIDCNFLLIYLSGFGIRHYKWVFSCSASSSAKFWGIENKVMLTLPWNVW